MFYLFHLFLFFFNATSTTEIYTLSLHDALPISKYVAGTEQIDWSDIFKSVGLHLKISLQRSEEHTSELQSRLHLVCRLLLEKKKKIIKNQVNLVVLTVL